MTSTDTIVVLDFETTGLSPGMGDRAIEIAAVCIENGKVIGTFQELMNPGEKISPFIEDYTGITNHMLSKMPPCEEVMGRFADFIYGYNLVAHNASFDKRFLDAELERISSHYNGEFVCSMLVSRRVCESATNYKLETLIKHVNIPTSGKYHRALYDSEMTTQLWLAILDKIKQRCSIQSIDFSLVKKLSKTPKQKVDKFFSQLK